MIGLCLLNKGGAEAAIYELQTGLSIAGRPAEEYDDIKYTLARAYQSIGDLRKAVAVLRELQTKRLSYVDDVKWRLRELEARLGQGTGLTGAPEGSVDAPQQTRSG